MNVAEIMILPIKGCRGISLQHATISPQGLLHDHNFMIVARRRQESHFESVGLQACPRLAYVQPAIKDTKLRIEYTLTGETLEVDFEPDRKTFEVLDEPIMLWKCPHRPIDLGLEASKFFSAIVEGSDVRFCYRASQPRLISGNMPPDTAQNGRRSIEAGLHAAFPLLLGSNSSLEELNGRIPPDEELPMERFRANIILEGFDPWAEDTWSKLSVDSGSNDEIDIHVVARCWRCPVTQVDLEKAKFTPQPLRELRRYRQIDSGAPAGSPVFGMYAGLCT